MTKRVSKEDTSRSVWVSWAALVRLPNTFTIIADVAAAFCLVVGGHGLDWSASVDQTVIVCGMGLALLSGISLYWGGMVLNDLFDVQRDLRAARGRPLPRREISLRAARWATGTLMILGVVFAGGIGGLASQMSSVSPTVSMCWTPVLVSLLIVLAVFLYDGPLKRTPVAPIVMGACRVLSFLLGATAATAVVGDTNAVTSDAKTLQGMRALGDAVIGDIRWVTLAFALGMGTYITGITTFGRRESIGDRTIHLPIGLALMFIGAAIIAFSPRLGGTDLLPEQSWIKAWNIDPVVIFPAAILLMVATTLLNGWKAATKPSPNAIQSTIRSALLAIIPIAAVITMLGLGAKPAIAVFALMLPSTWLSKRFRMT